MPTVLDECNIRSRVLEPGDLVRVKKIFDKRLKNYDGSLGKVTKVSPLPQSVLNGNKSDHHPFVYDVDFILGGKINKCFRQDLLYTTADAEGMVHTARVKRQRKHNDTPDLLNQNRLDTHESSGVTKVAKKIKKSVTKTPPSQKEPSKKRGSTSTGKSKSISKKAKNGHISVPVSEDIADDIDDNILAKDLFEKHRKEFERCFVRLEKMDRFGFFFEVPIDQSSLGQQIPVQLSKDVPSIEIRPSNTKSTEHSITGQTAKDTSISNTEASITLKHSEKEDEEHYVKKASNTTTTTTVSISNQIKACDTSQFGAMAHGLGRKIECNPVTLPASSHVSDQISAAKSSDHVEHISEPPRTWYDLRERRDAGRYFIDRLTKLEKERAKRLRPYLWERRKKKRSCEVERGKLGENWDLHIQSTEPHVKQLNGKRCLIRNGIRIHPRILHPKGIDWEQFKSDVLEMCNAGIARDPYGGNDKHGTIGHTARKIKELLEQIYERTGRKQISELDFADARHEFSILLKAQNNEEAALQGEWRQLPFPKRNYQRLSSDIVCAGLSPFDEWSASCEKQTTLQDSFVGLAYSYDDTGESEGWMKSVFKTAKSNTKEQLSSEEEKAANALAADNGVVRAQVRATMRKLLIAVQDKVLTDTGVLKQKELLSTNYSTHEIDDSTTNSTLSSLDNAATQKKEKTSSVENDTMLDLLEQSVWGIDCYTRRNVIICLEKDLDSETAIEFVEKWLLPAINACPENLAHDMQNAVKILELLAESTESVMFQVKPQIQMQQNLYSTLMASLIGKALLQKIKLSRTPWLRAATYQLHRAIESLGHDFFRVHPKGHGSILLRSKLKANTLVTFYRGEVYPSWRWGEKLDAIEMTQQYIGLRPNLPDFYNMALERPQADPKGYGLMILDASRKAGHGSMLSHSCDPTCEVRVTAVNGQLCLAMTTLRDVEQGEELTFDYNAVTESLTEYQAAVCLCGFNKCRGSFLHYATADCYQRVLNRNSPIAVRFANLVKACNKMVMAEDDVATLNRHGFKTAAFGPISLNRNLETNSNSFEGTLDSMDYVPVWLKTYVADILRYIEYERRALPITLLCDHFKNDQDQPESGLIEGAVQSTRKKKSSEHREKPENSFQHYVRINKESLIASIQKESAQDATKVEMQQKIRTAASAQWKQLSDSEKSEWKNKAIADWEQQRICHNQHEMKSNQMGSNTPNDNKKGCQGNGSESLNLSRISFEAADAEGVSAMEQRIQQLTQSLSRIGRVLDHHRYKTQCQGGNSKTLQAEKVIHSPLAIMSDREVVAWMWCSEHGLVKSLLRVLSQESCPRSTLIESLSVIISNHRALERYSENGVKSGMSGHEARKMLTKGLLELRECLQDHSKEVAKEFRRAELQKARAKAKAKRDDAMLTITKEVIDVLQNVIDRVVGDEKDVGNPNYKSFLSTWCQVEGTTVLSMVSTIESFGDRWKLEAAADIFLLYARTTNFFKVVPYTVLESTPIEVYARELGNNIQVEDITHVKEDKHQRSTNVILVDDLNPVKGHYYVNSNEKKSDEHPSEVINKKKHEKEFCDPESVVANVKVKYEGDYVLSQLLQWFNGGIGQKPGLPDMLGCVLLPSVEATLACSSVPGKKNQRASFYSNQIRPQLFDWLSDIHQRGNPFPETLSRLFLGPNSGDSSTSPSSFPIGSPILDLLVMGDDFNIISIMDALKRDIQHQGKLDGSKDFATRQLESSIDEAMPAQAVANWVQCENENCLKWRRLPFYVDVDALPEKFFCKDNVWNPNAQSCDALEDTWDEKDNFLQSKGIDSKASPSSKSTRIIGCNDEVIPPSFDYRIGSHHDDLRKDVKQIITGQIVEINENENGKKRLKFHHLKDSNELVECNDNRSKRVSILCIKEPKREVQNINMIAGGANILIAENTPSKEASLDSTHGQNDVEKAHGSFQEISDVPNPSSIAVTLLSLRQPPKAQGLIRHSLKASKEKLFYDDSLTKQKTSPLDACGNDSADKNPANHRPCINPRRVAVGEANISSLGSKDCIWKEHNSLSDKSLAVKYSVSANHATKDHVPKVPKLAKSPINGDKVLNFQKLQPHVNVPKSNATLLSASEVTKRIPRKANVTSDGGLTLRRSLLETFDDKKQSTLNSKWSHGTNDKIYQSRIPTPSLKKDGLFHLKKSTGFDQMDQSIEGKHQSMIDRKVFQREHHYSNLENKEGVIFQQSQNSDIDQKLHVVHKSP